MFFSLFPKLQVVSSDGKSKLMPDIFRRVSINKFSANFVDLDTLTIPDGYTPEQLADKIYGDAQLHWVILVINDIVDARNEWPIGAREISEYCKLKYGPAGMYEVHHYRTTDDNKFIVDYDAAKLSNGEIEEVTNLVYETELNDAKREILILPKRYLSSFTQYYWSLIK